MTDNADNAQRRFLADMVAARRRAVFVAAALWLSFHGFGLLVLIYGGSMSPLIAALFYDGLAALGFGLWHLAKRIYP